MCVSQGLARGRATCWLRCGMEACCSWTILDRVATCNVARMHVGLVSAKAFGAQVCAIAECVIVTRSIFASRCDGIVAPEPQVSNSLCHLGED